MKKCKEFIDNMFKSAGEGYLVLWENKDNKSRFFTTGETEQLIGEALSMSKDKNVYYGLGLINDKPKKGRGKADDIIGIGAIWLDLDISGANHKNSKLPTELQAMALIDSFPLKPTAIIQSGGGYHVYWFLKEVWLFDSSEVKEQAEKLLEDFQKSFKELANKSKFNIDSTHDLSRVLRLPGTLNHKTNPPKNVEICKTDYSIRYNIDEIKAVIHLNEEADKSTVNEEFKKGRTPNTANAEFIYEQCAFIQHCIDDAESLPEPEWYTALSIIARCKDGEELCHEISKPYPGYSEIETQKKIAHALKDTGPATCEFIRKNFNYCNDCSKNVKSPILLGKTNTVKNEKTLKTTKLSTVKEEHVDWLWEPYIPNKKLTIMEGDPGSGKTWIAMSIAADLSKGSLSNSCSPENVLIVTAEDGIADTIVPRLKSLEANMDNIHVIEGVQDDKGDIVSMFDFKDLEPLDQKLEDLKPKLLIVDPIQAFLGKGVDMHKANDVRSTLTPLIKLIEKHDCALICIRHLNKNSGNKGMYRGMGSIDFTAAARSVLVVAPNPEAPHIRSMAHVKSSLASVGLTMNFAIIDGKFEWLGESDISAEDLLNPKANTQKKEPEIVRWLRDLLSGGEMASKEIENQGKPEGYTPKQIRRAGDKLGVIKEKKKDGWFTKLPNDEKSRCPSNSTNGKVGHLGQIGHLGQVEEVNFVVDIPEEKNEESKLSRMVKIIEKEHQKLIMSSDNPIDKINYQFNKGLNEYLKKNPKVGYYYYLIDNARKNESTSLAI